jgi:hypothetical protein
MRSTRVLPFFAVGLLATLAGCGKPDVLPVTAANLEVLRNIYNASGATFHGSQLNIDVRPGGTVEIEMSGRLDARKEPPTETPEPNDTGLLTGPVSLDREPAVPSRIDQASNRSAHLIQAKLERVSLPQKNEPPTSTTDAPSPDKELSEIWIPVLLTEELPPYYSVIAPSDLSRVSLEAYHLKGGLWCLAAVVRNDSPQAPSNSNPAPQFLNFRIALSSPDFTEALPFVIPAGQTGEPLGLSVTLPRGSSFESGTSTITMRSARHWRQLAYYEGKVARTSQTLTAIPPSLGDTGARQVATVYSPDALGWDLSEVKFTQPGWLSYYKPWYLPSLCLLACLGAAFLILVSRSLIVDPPLGSIELEDWRNREALAYAYISQLTTDDFRERDPETFHAAESWQRKFSTISENLRESRRAFDPRRLRMGLEDLDALISEILSYRAPQWKKEPHQKPAQGPIASITWNLQNLRFGLEDAQSKQVSTLGRRKRQAKILLVLLAMGVLALVSIGFLIATLARAQSLPKARPHTVVPTTQLCDLDISLSPHDPGTTAADAVDVTLRFIPLTGVRNQKTGTLEIGIGNAGPMSLQGFVPPTDKNLVVVQHSWSLITLSFPTTYTPYLARIGRLEGGIDGSAASSDYAAAIAKANLFNFTYTIAGAEIKHERVADANHTLYLFPFDSVDVTVPFDLRRDALLWHLALLKPVGDLYASPSVDGVSIPLAESENADKYEFQSSDDRSRIALAPSDHLVIRAQFERTNFQKWGSLLVITLIAIFVGILAGHVQNLPDNHWLGVGIQFGAFAGMLVAVRVAVLGAYKWLPTVMAFQAVSIFELIFGLALVLQLVAFAIAVKKFK